MIKSFEQFHNQSATAPAPPTSEINEETKEKVKVGQETPREGEVARWGVVLKGSGAEAESGINYKGVIEQLAQSEEFKAWWNATDPARKVSNFTLLALIDASHKDAGFLRKERTGADVAFMVYLKGTQAAYDVHSAVPVVDGVQVGDSPVKLTAWKMEDLPKLKLYSRDYNDSWNRHTKGTPIIEFGLNLDHVNNLGTDQSKYSPYAIYHNLIGYYKSSTNGTVGTAGTAGHAAQQVVAPVQPTAVVTGTAGTSGSQPTHSMTIPYQGLKMEIPTRYNRAIADLQSRMSKFSQQASAALRLNNGNGIDGKYGHHTAMAIGIVIGTNQEVTEITPDVANQLEAKLNGIVATSTTAPIATGTSGTAGQAKPIATNPIGYTSAVATAQPTTGVNPTPAKIMENIGNYARFLEIKKYQNVNESK